MCWLFVLNSLTHTFLNGFDECVGRIAIEKQENYTWKIPFKYHTFLANMTAAIGRRLNATSRKRVEIKAYWLSQKEKKTFRRENLSQY